MKYLLLLLFLVASADAMADDKEKANEPTRPDLILNQQESIVTTEYTIILRVGEGEVTEPLPSAERQRWVPIPAQPHYPFLLINQQEK